MFRHILKLLIVSLLPHLALAQTVTVNSDFKSSTAPGWVFGGTGYTPTLTSGTIDPSGDGWLRLTDNGTYRATYAYFDTPIASANRTIFMSIDFASYNGIGGGADGIGFFLFDASKSFSVGADGGSLGYAQKTAVSGMNGGYLGVGIDDWGNFSAATEGRIGGIGQTPNSVAVRGPGDGLTGYEYLGGTGDLASAPYNLGQLDFPGYTTRPDQTGADFRHAELVLTATNQLSVYLQFGANSDLTKVLTLDLSGYARPDELKFGFFAGSGAATNIHEIRSFTYTSLQSNQWDGGSGDGLWGTATNWNPDFIPAVGADILLDNAFVSTSQTINLETDRILRNLQIDAPFNYTLNNGSLTFNNSGIPGLYGINITQTNGAATTQTINSNIIIDNDILIRNNTSAELQLNGTITTNGNDIQLEGSGVTNIAGQITGAGSLTKTETGTTILSGNNTYSGGTQVSGGTVVANHNNALGTGTVTLAGGTLTSTSSNTISNAVTVTNNASINNITLSGTTTQSGGSYTLGLNNAQLSGNVNLATAGDATARTLTIQTDTANTSTISGVIANGGTAANGITKTGGGELILSGANTYTGNTTISSGTLSLGNNDRISNSSTVNITGGILNLDGYSEQVNNLGWSNSGTLDFGTTGTSNYFLFQNVTGTQSGVLTISNWESGSDILASQTALAGTVLQDFYFVGYGAGATQAAAQTVTGYGSGWRPINPNTSGWFTWDSGNNTNRWDRGANWDSNSVPTSGAKVAFGTGAQTSVDLRNNRTVEAIRFDEGAASFTLNNNTLTFNGPGTLAFIQQRSSNLQTINSAITLTDNTVVDMIGSGNLALTGAISGSANLVKENTGGELILSGTSTSYSGNIFVNAGTITANSNSALGATSGTTTVSSGATLNIGTSSGLTIAENISISGTGVSGAGAIRSSNTSGTNTLSGTITLADNSTIQAGTGGTLALSGNITSSTNKSLTLTGSGNTTVSGTLTLGTGGVNINSTGTVTYSGTAANTYTGVTQVNSGTLVLSKTAGTNAIGTGGVIIGDGTGTDTLSLGASNQISDAATVQINNGGIFNLNNFNETIAKLDATSSGATVQLGTGNLTVNNSIDSSYQGAITGSGSIIKSGVGKLTLSGNNTSYTGNTQVNSGILSVQSSNALGTGAVTVATSGNLELQNNVSVANNFTINGPGTGATDGAIENISGTNTISGTITVATDSTIKSNTGTLNLNGNITGTNRTLTVGGNGNTVFNGTTNLGSSGTLNKIDNGNLNLNNNLTAGTLNIQGGQVQLLNNNLLSDSLTVNISEFAALNLGNYTDTISSLNGAGDLSMTGGSLTLLGTSNFSGDFTGNGTLNLASGSTTTLSGDVSNSNFNLVLSGGTLILGSDITLGNLTITSNSTIDFASTNFDLSFLNNLTIASDVILTILNWQDGANELIASNFSGASYDTRGSTPMNQIVFQGWTANDTRWHSFDNQISPVPEPSTYGLIFMALTTGLMWYLRRQKRK